MHVTILVKIYFNFIIIHSSFTWTNRWYSLENKQFSSNSNKICYICKLLWIQYETPRNIQISSVLYEWMNGFEKDSKLFKIV